MTQRRKIEVIRTPHPDAEKAAAEALDVLAEALADRVIERARREVARRRGVSEKDIDREHERVAEAARALSTMGVGAGDRARRGYSD